MVTLAFRGCALAACLVYLGLAARKTGAMLPGEAQLLEWLARWLLPARPGWDGALGGLAAQEVLVLQTGLFFAVASGVFLEAVRAVVRSPLPLRRVMVLVLGFSAALRLGAVAIPPVLETDHHRYHWDGAVLMAGFNPYEFAPDEVAREAARAPAVGARRTDRSARLASLAARSREPALAGHFQRINHPEVATFYPPAAQALFGLAHSISPGNDLVLKGLVALLDLGVTGLTAVLLLRLGQDPRWAVAYGWCPLLLKEYAGTGHAEPLAGLLVLASLLCLLGGRRTAAGLALGTAVLARLYPLVLLPVLGRSLGRRGTLALALALAAGYGPFVEHGGPMLGGLGVFASRWEFNSSLPALATAALQPLFNRHDPLTLTVAVTRKDGEERLLLASQNLDAFFWAKALCAAALAGVLLLLAWRPARDDRELTARAGLAIAAVLVLSPVADPWYFGWVAPFACVFPSAAAAWLAWGMSLYYFYFLAFAYPWWSRPLEYGPAAALLALDVRRWRRRR
jgi:hypothetical protein